MSAISTISYCKYFNSQKDVHTVSHDDLDSNSIDIKYFIEILKNPEVIRPYFDFDEHDINNKQDWDEFIAELDRLSNSLGPYCIAGYTTNKELHDITGLQYYETIKGLPVDKEPKKISMHVVFYEAAVKTNDWLEIVKKNSQYEQPKFNYDHDVYKLKSSQLMRHPLSYKPYKPQEVIQCSGNIIVPENAKNSYACITPKGDETALELDEYDDVFPKMTTVDDAKVDKLFEKHDMKKVVKPRDDNVVIEEDLDDIHTIMSVAVSGSTFGHDDSIKDLMLYIPKNNYEMFMNVYKEYYNKVAHKTEEDLDKVYQDTVAKHRAKGFCQVMSNIKNKYYEVYNGDKINELKELSKEKLEKAAEDDKTLLDNYKRFMKSWYNIVNEYFDNYDYIHTSATEERLLQKEVTLKRYNIQLSKTYKRLYARKVLYICNDGYIYRKNDSTNVYRTLDNKAFKLTLKRIYQLNKVDDAFMNSLKVFKAEAILESHDGLVYPKYRDMKYDYSLTDEEFATFCNAYRSTFKNQKCADFAVKLLIQDIASGFHDNSFNIKFYYGTGGNNKDCETCIYENIIGVHDLVFKTHDFKVLADEKNKCIVSSLYVQFNEMPATSPEKFMEFVNALKNYNESGFVKTRALYRDFETIETNIRFQCNTNNMLLRDWLLRGANDAIKRRFFVAERVHSDEWSDWLYLFCHDVKKCRALKMYIVNNKDKLYTEKLNNNSMLKFWHDNHELYDIYTESDKIDLNDRLKQSLNNCYCPVAKRTAKADTTTFAVNISEWHREYKQFEKSIKLADFKSLVIEHLTLCKTAYISDNGSFKRVYDKYLFASSEFIDFLNSSIVNSVGNDQIDCDC